MPPAKRRRFLRRRFISLHIRQRRRLPPPQRATLLPLTRRHAAYYAMPETA